MPINMECKIAYHLDKVSQFLRGDTPTPVTVEVSPVGYCNNKCIFCAYDFARKDSILETETAVKALQGMGTSGVRAVVFAGEGEPLLHPDIDQLVDAAQSSMDVGIYTNGLKSTPELMDKILPQLTFIRFSLDAGDPVTHANVHGVRNCFETVVQNIYDAVHIKTDQNLPVTIGLQFVAIDQNVHSLGNFMELFLTSGVDYIAIKPYSQHPRSANVLNPRYEDMEAEIRKVVLYTVNRQTSERLPDVHIRNVEYSDQQTPEFDTCPALNFFGYLDSAGDFFACPVGHEERNKCGNIYKMPMHDMLNGVERFRIINEGNQPGYTSQCRNNCRGANVNRWLLDKINKDVQHINFI